MLQVVIQSTMRQLKSKLKLSASPSNSEAHMTPGENQDRTGFILALALVGGILLFAIFSNLPRN